MVRIYRELLERLLMGVVMMEEKLKLGPAHAYNHLVSNSKYGVRTDSGRIFNSIMSHGSPNMGHSWNKDMEEASSILVGRAGNGSYGSNDSMLLDAVVSILKMPYGRNAISGATYDALKRAILMPEEMSEALEAKNVAHSCINCGKRFQNGEMATAIIDNGYMTFRCARCNVPTYHSCAHCDETTNISEKVYDALLRRKDCGCRTKKADKKIDETPTPTRVLNEDDEIQDRIGRAVRRARGGRITTTTAGTRRQEEFPGRGRRIAQWETLPGVAFNARQGETVVLGPGEEGPTVAPAAPTITRANPADPMITFTLEGDNGETF